jgi:hypothetical protein
LFGIFLLISFENGILLSFSIRRNTKGISGPLSGSSKRTGTKHVLAFCQPGWEAATQGQTRLKIWSHSIFKCPALLGVGFDSNSKWFSNGQYSVCFRIKYFICTVIMYVYVDSPSQVRRKVRDSTYV